MRHMRHALGIGLTLVLGSSWVTSAPGDEAPLLCEDASVAGIYGLQSEDFLALSGNREAAVVGVLHLRSNGTATLTFDGFTKAKPANRPVDEVWEGSWSLDADCIGSVMLNGRTGEDAWRFVAPGDPTDLLFVNRTTLKATSARPLTSKRAPEDPPLVVARQALTAFTEAVEAGPEALDAILAPEFQLLRANGVGYDREGYLASDLPEIDTSFERRFEDLTVTMQGEIMVVRYVFVISETIEGEPAAMRAPRLSVFRFDGERWLIVSHANFAA